MSGQLGSLRLLIVDDNEHLRTIVTTVLGGAGIRQTRCVDDGEVALGLVQSWRPDVAIIDYHMEPLDGVAFTLAVRRMQGEVRFLPIIMLTGHSIQSRILAARDAGVTEIVTKPVIPAALFERLSSVIFKPRPFIETKTYFGPDRRRHLGLSYPGPLRRESDQELCYGETSSG